MPPATAQLSGDQRLPLYQRVTEALKTEIAERRWHPGDRLPAEKELSARYNVAIGTIRQAISQLIDIGFLERRHGSGTFVRKPSFDTSLFRFFRFQTEDGERQVPESRILSREILSAPSKVSGALGLNSNSKVISMSRLRLIRGEPVLAEEIWLDHAHFETFTSMSESDIGPLLYPLYESQFGQVVARAQENLIVEAVDDAYARLLRVPPGTPVIVIERLALGYDGKPIEWRRSRGRADQFQYHIEIH